MSPGALPPASVFEHVCSYESAEGMEHEEVAIKTAEDLKYTLVAECVQGISEKYGVPIGCHAANLANGEKAFARAVDHAAVDHGIGVATVAFRGDQCDPEPVCKHDSLTALTTSDDDDCVVAEVSGEITDIPYVEIADRDRVYVVEGMSAQLGKHIGTCGGKYLEGEVVTAVDSEVTGRGCCKAEPCSCDRSTLCQCHRGNFTLVTYREYRGTAFAFEDQSLAMSFENSDSGVGEISVERKEPHEIIRLARGCLVKCEIDITDIPIRLSRHHSCHIDLYNIESFPLCEVVDCRTFADNHTGGTEYVTSYSSHSCPPIKVSCDSGSSSADEFPINSSRQGTAKDENGDITLKLKGNAAFLSLATEFHGVDITCSVTSPTVLFEKDPDRDFKVAEGVNCPTKCVRCTARQSAQLGDVNAVPDKLVSDEAVTKSHCECYCITVKRIEDPDCGQPNIVTLVATESANVVSVHSNVIEGIVCDKVSRHGAVKDTASASVFTRLPRVDESRYEVSGREGNVHIVVRFEPDSVELTEDMAQTAAQASGKACGCTDAVCDVLNEETQVVVEEVAVKRSEGKMAAKVTRAFGKSANSAAKQVSCAKSIRNK